MIISTSANLGTNLWLRSQDDTQVNVNPQAGDGRLQVIFAIQR